MSFWTFVFLCVIAGIGYDIWHKKHLAKHGIVRDWLGNESKPGIDPHSASQVNGELQREVEQLRERVRVLERIATDEARPIALAHEIESLRDKS